MRKKPLLKVQNVSKHFGGVIALNKVQLELYQREILGLIGPNGSGKTTLFNVIFGTYLPNRGCILFEDYDITNLRPHHRCHLGIARTFQLTKPFLRLSVIENVMVGAYFGTKKRSTLAAAKERASTILDLVGLGDRKADLASNLTLCEQRKLELARAFATQPKVLLLDEVLAGLAHRDILGMIEVIHYIHNSGVTLLMIEHDMRVIMEISERIMVLYNGENFAEGLPEDIIQNDQVITAYLGRKQAQ